MTNRTLVATALTAALLTGGAAAPAFAQTSTDYPSDTATTTTKKKGKKAAHRYTTAQLTAVATTLGVTLDELKAAQAKVKKAVAATEARETQAEQDALLATELGKTTAEVQAAFAAVAQTRGTRGDGDRRGGHGGGGRGGDCGGGSGSYPSDSSGSYPSDSSGSYPSDTTATTPSV